MPQSQGINCKVGYQAETVFRQVPGTPDLKQLYFESESLGANFNLITSNIIRPGANPVMPSRGNQDGTIGFKTTLAPQLATLINKGILGSNTTTGAGPYTHVGKIGALSSFYFEKGITDQNLYLLYNGCKFRSLEVEFSNEGPIGCAFEGSACAESMALPYDGQTGNFTVGNVVTGGTSGATALIISDLDAGATGTLIVTGVSGAFQDNETLTDGATGSALANIPNGIAYAPVDAAYSDPGHSPWDAYEITLVQEGGSGTLLNVQKALVKIARAIDTGTYVIGGRGTRNSLPEGRAKVSGSITALFDAQALALFHKAIRFQESSLKIVAQHGTGAGTAGNEYFELLIPELKWGKDTPKVSGPQGMVIDIPFEAYYDNDANASAVVVTFKNATATI